MNAKKLDVLYVEDDPADVELAQTALEDMPEHASRFKMHVVEDGDQALKFLNRTEPYKEAAMPDMILLDLNLPKTHGTEVLKAIKDSDLLHNIPVVIFTTSKSQVDIDKSYNLGANAFLTKPGEYNEYVQTFQSVYNFWLKRNNFPTKH